MSEVSCPNCQYGLTALVASAIDPVVCPECGLTATAHELSKPRVLVLRLRRSDILAPVGLAFAVSLLCWLFLSITASPLGVLAAALTPVFLIPLMCIVRMREYRSRAGYWSCLVRAVLFRLLFVWAVCAAAAVLASVGLIIASRARRP